MKKIYLLLSLLIITAGCVKKELFSPATEADATEMTLHEIDFKDLPAKISNNFNDEHYFVQKSGKSEKLFGPVSFRNKVQKLNYHKALSSYTFAFVPDIKDKYSENYYFDNLVLKEQADGSIKSLIIRYEPSKEWREGPRDFQDYSGKIIYIDTEGKKRNEIVMENGRPLPQY